MSTVQDMREFNYLVSQISKSIRHLPLVRWLQPVEYDSRTDVIQPVGASHDGRYLAAWMARQFDGLSYGYAVAEPVTGWGRYTHLIQFDDSAVFALAQIHQPNMPSHPWEE